MKPVVNEVAIESSITGIINLVGSTCFIFTTKDNRKI